MVCTLFAGRLNCSNCQSQKANNQKSNDKTCFVYRTNPIASPKSRERQSFTQESTQQKNQQSRNPSSKAGSKKRKEKNSPTAILLKPPRPQPYEYKHTVSRNHPLLSLAPYPTDRPPRILNCNSSDVLFPTTHPITSPHPNSAAQQPPPVQVPTSFSVRPTSNTDHKQPPSLPAPAHSA